MAMVCDLVPHLVFGAANPISASFMNAINGKEIDVCLIHHSERKWLSPDPIRLVTVMPLTICNMDVGRNASRKI